MFLSSTAGAGARGLTSRCLFGSIGIYLSPKSMQKNSPTPIITAIKAITLHTFRVQLEPSQTSNPAYVDAKDIIT